MRMVLFCYDYLMEHYCYSRNNVEVMIESIDSHIATHFADTPILRAAVNEIISMTDIVGKDMFFEYDLGRIIGTTDLVDTTSKDEIVFAKRKNRDIYTRFTKSQQPIDCSTVTVALKKMDEDHYMLWSAWIGFKGPAFPGDFNETPDSKQYWSKHALVWGRQEVQLDTVTSDSPW